MLVKASSRRKQNHFSNILQADDLEKHLTKFLQSNFEGNFPIDLCGPILLQITQNVNIGFLKAETKVSQKPDL